MGGITPPTMSAATLDKELSWHSQDTGIPKRELRRMCLAAGLELLQRGELKVTKKSAPKKKGALTK